MKLQDIENRFKYYNYLGFHNPFYKLDIHSNQFVINDSFESILESEEKKVFDYVAFVELVNMGFALGDRTLVKKISKTPWMSKPSEDLRKWEIVDNLIKHSEQVFSQEEVANKLFLLLRDEIRSYIKNSDRIGILLTGGMDSRIVACVLKSMSDEGDLKGKTITGFTWGSKDSRDVVYAKKIADIFGWNWKHLIVDLEQMKKNIEISIRNGCEYSPVHLHAMSQLAERTDIDCYLAGSFGDSIGRAEYAGQHVLKVKSMEDKFNNSNTVVRSDINILFAKELTNDFNFYRSKFKQENDYKGREIDEQAHYMRRMLNSCMSIINKNIPLHQAFTAPEVFSYVWSISPELRNDNIYNLILKKYGKDLIEIPWARTGLLYPSKNGVALDTLKKNHHDYGNLIKTSFLDFIEDTVLGNYKNVSKHIIDKSIFIILLKNIKKYPIEGQYLLESKLLHIACIVKMLSDKNIKFESLPNYKSSFFKVLKIDLKYKTKYFLKK